MDFAHNTIWNNLLCPLVVVIERNWVSALSIHPRPIKVNDKCTIIGRVVEDVRVPKTIFCLWRRDIASRTCSRTTVGIGVLSVRSSQSDFPSTRSITTMYRPPTTCAQKCSLGANPALARIRCASSLYRVINLTTTSLSVPSSVAIYNATVVFLRSTRTEAGWPAWDRNRW